MLTRFQQTVMHAHGISRKQISIIPYGVDVAGFKFHARPFSMPLQLIFIGNLNRVKDPFTLINTFHALTKKHECRLTIIGSDILHGEVQAYAKELGVNEKIQWKGKLSYENIPSELSFADILLLTSLYEGQAAVILEAFASGVIVVGTNVGLLADIGNDALTASPGDAIGLANIIDELIRHPEHIGFLQSKNRNYAETFSAEWTFKEYVKLYDELIA
jgi:glycosyltransferase involved in cell wall biosynthesis